MRIGVLGINHKLANLELRELLAQACQRCFIGGSLSHVEHSCILLTTCNRTEIYFSSSDLAVSHSYLLQMLKREVFQEFDQKVYSYFGYECFLHLGRVTAGLDSAIFAETEIQGQVKSAYDAAATSVSLPHELHYLFQNALKIGKNIRTEFALGRGMPDLEHAIYQAGLNLFKTPSQTRILFVGASEVNCKVLTFLKSKNCHDITIINRSPQKAKALAEMHQLSTLDWSRVHDWHAYHWVIFGTKAPHYLATKRNLPATCCGQKLVIDLSVPRNVEPIIGRDPGITLLNIDQINRILKVRKQRMKQVISAIEQKISLSSQMHVDRFVDKVLTKIATSKQNIESNGDRSSVG